MVERNRDKATKSGIREKGRERQRVKRGRDAKRCEREGGRRDIQTETEMQRVG